MKQHRNVTLSLPETLLQRFRVFAAQRNQSMTELMAEAIEALMDQGRRSARAKQRFLRRIREAPDRGTKGKLRWTREDLHER